MLIPSMQRANRDVCDPRYGEVDNILEQLTKSKGLHILMVLERSSRPLRFSEVKSLVDAPSTTISRRLKELEEYGLVERIADENGKLNLYGPTEDTKSLSPIMQSLFDWVSIRFNRFSN